MSRSKVRTSNSVSLFPFLAVLVCAMGALIFLLLVTTRRIRHNAVMQAIVAAETQDDESNVIPVDVPILPPEVKPEAPAIPVPSAVAAPVPKIVEKVRPDPNAKLEELIAVLSQQREQQQKRYEEHRRLVLAAKSRISAADAQLNRLKQTFKKKQEERLTVSVDRQVKRAEYTRLGEDIDEAVVYLRRMEQENANRSTKFAVVAFDGQSGTTRRPILIECTKDGLVFMQEQITLTAAHVDGFTIYNNPLLAGTRALMQHWRSRQQVDQEGQVIDSPYVLLIVRPGGSIAYYAARNMLRELSQDTGYELVEAEREIAVPPADPQATAVCRQAIETVLAGRRETGDGLIAGRQGSDGVLRFKRGSGGFEPLEEEKSIYERAGQPGFGNRKAAGRGSSEFRGSGSGRGSDKTPGTGRLASSGQNLNGTNGRQGKNNGQGPEVGDGGRFLRPLGTGENGTASQPGGRSRETAAGPGGEGPAGQNGLPDGDTIGLIGEKSLDGNLPGNLGASTGSGDNPLLRDMSRNGSSDRGGYRPGIDQSGIGQPDSGQPGGRQQSSGQPNSDMAGGFPAGGNGSRTSAAATASGARGGAQGGGTSQGGSANGETQSGGSQMPAASAGPQLPMPLRTFGRANGAELPSSSGRSASRAWGISHARNGIGFERETTIHVTAETIRVGTQPEIDIARFKTYEALRERVLDDLDRHARTWGAPPQNFHWVPVVRFRVSPGGNLYYERLHGPLRKVGISSSVEYPLDTPAPRRRTE